MLSTLCFNSFLHNHMFHWPWTRVHLQTLWKKEKMLVTSNFSFSYVFWPPQNLLVTIILLCANAFNLVQSKILLCVEELKQHLPQSHHVTLLFSCEFTLVYHQMLKWQLLIFAVINWPVCFSKKPWFLLVCSIKSFENNVGKGEIAHHKQYLNFWQCFLPFCGTCFHFN